MLLDEAHQWLGWPQAEQIFDPPGEGARVYAEFAKRKIEDALKRAFPRLPVKTGVLAINPLAVETSQPLAVICEFARPVDQSVLDEAHRLAWNFSRTPLLITLEPHRLIAWSCYRDPKQPEEDRKVCSLDGSVAPSKRGHETQRIIRDMLHWVSLVTGNLLRQKQSYFPKEGRADELLLKNLIDVRRKLLKKGLPKSTCHDLLARVIFTQYLFHRKDSDGNAFFSPKLLARLERESIFSQPHADLASVLGSHEDTYALFLWLDERFNGDLFPGKQESRPDVNEAAWAEERAIVTPDHLKLLAELVSGTIHTKNRQLLLWPQYSFDTIPLEFISSVYEEFLNEDRYKNKAFYTPPHLVDYVLDAVLPWGGREWNLNILDPSCGSGIFLVKAFQRLIHRWRRAHGREPLVSDIKPLLAKNIVGVDINSEAVRVACFSLYLAMADAIEPKHYVTREKVFPPLRGTRLLAADFFNEEIEAFSTENGCVYDVIAGNAPWGDKSIRKTSDPTTSQKGHTLAEVWAAEHKWPVANFDIGPMFLCKGIRLLSEDGSIALVQPAGPWLYHRGKPAVKMREKLFRDHRVDEITNLSAIRRELFTDVIGPACIFVAGKTRPSSDEQIFYLAPKPLKHEVGTSRFLVEPQDISSVSSFEASHDPLVWTVLALGGRRDLNLVRKLRKFPTLAELRKKGQVVTREGVVIGDASRELPEFRDAPFLSTEQFPDDVFLHLDASTLPKWSEPRVHSRDSSNFKAFRGPQLLIKQGLSVESGRFRAAITSAEPGETGVICTQSYLTVRDMDVTESNIKAACIGFNSRLATYFFAVTGSRLGHYRPELQVNELMSFPVPAFSGSFADIDSFDDIDDACRKMFGLNSADWCIVEDLLGVTFPETLRKTPGTAYSPTCRSNSSKKREPELIAYADTIRKVLQSTFGDERKVGAVIYQEPHGEELPVRMLTLAFGVPDSEPTIIEQMEADVLLDGLSWFHNCILSAGVQASQANGIGFQRVAFFVHPIHSARGVKGLTIVKPDETRYWTKSMAMRDADDLSAAILNAAGWKDET
jgi:type I restriction-modification system DNA methylase subunit